MLTHGTKERSGGEIGMDKDNRERIKEYFKAQNESENVIRKSVRELEIATLFQGIAIVILSVSLIIHIIFT